MRFPIYRPRRLRQNPKLRAPVRETELSAGDLVMPLFVRDGSRLRKPISSMPGQFQLSVDELVELSGHSVDRLAEVLFSLEIKGRIQHLPGQRYVTNS